MNSRVQAVHGSCYCGAVSVAVSAAMRRPVNCHCGQCRRLSGAAFTTWLTAPREASTLRGSEHLTSFKPTENLERFFCSVCGSHVLTADERMPDVYGFPAGVFEGEAIKTPRSNYFFDNRATWCDNLASGNKCFGGSNGMEPIDA